MGSSAPQHPATLTIEALRAECETRFQRRSGPGGQHRNKVETMAHVTHCPSGIEASASERRQQAQNLSVAFERLRKRLALELRYPWQQPSTVWQRRCQSGRITVSPQHEDFARCLSEALDALAACDWQHTTAAERLGCSSTQLLRLLKLEPAAFQQLNQQRSSRGLRPLK